jgi:hypothetical protein
MKTKNIEFQISQLSQDKVISTIQAVAVAITALVASSLISLVASFGLVPEMYLFYLNIAIFVGAIGYTIFVLVDNAKRLKKIKALEK